MVNPPGSCAPWVSARRVRIADQRRIRVQIAPQTAENLDNRRRFKASVNQSQPNHATSSKGGTVQKQASSCGAAAVCGSGPRDLSGCVSVHERILRSCEASTNRCCVDLTRRLSWRAAPCGTGCGLCGPCWRIRRFIDGVTVWLNLRVPFCATVPTGCFYAGRLLAHPPCGIMGGGRCYNRDTGAVWVFCAQAWRPSGTRQTAGAWMARGLPPFVTPRRWSYRCRYICRGCGKRRFNQSALLARRLPASGARRCAPMRLRRVRRYANRWIGKGGANALPI